jgi:hypothetical protein
MQRTNTGYDTERVPVVPQSLQYCARSDATNLRTGEVGHKDGAGEIRGITEQPGTALHQHQHHWRACMGTEMRAGVREGSPNIP